MLMIQLAETGKKRGKKKEKFTRERKFTDII